MDTFIDSSWYFLRYPDANESSFRLATNDWMPVDQYWAELNTQFCTCYSRFFTKVLRDSPRGDIATLKGKALHAAC